MKYIMTQEQFDKLLASSKPVMMIALQCGTPRSPQKNANTAWEALGEELGFDFRTVKPVRGHPLEFTAEETT